MDKINRIFLSGDIAALGTADTTMIPCPLAGDITNMWVTNEIILTSADEDLTISAVTAAGVATAVVGGVMTIANATSAALATNLLAIAKVATTRVEAGGSIRVVNDGASTSAGPAKILIEVTI